MAASSSARGWSGGTLDARGLRNVHGVDTEGKPPTNRRGMRMQPWKMPNWDEYYMGIAVAVREKANCLGSRVGAVIVRDNRVISTGYNGVPEGMQNCLDGGCHRCSNTAIYKSGEAYDLCICVHAEQNALITAARFGIAVFGATLYTTMKPCFNCAKEILQAGVVQVCYIHEWQPGDDLKRAEHKKIIGRIKLVRKIDYPDPRPEWLRAISLPKSAPPPDAHAPDSA